MHPHSRLLGWIAATLLVTLMLLTVAIALMSGARGNRSVKAPPAAASYAAPLLGLLVTRDLEVVSLDWWSPARRAGVQPGDVLRSMGSVDLPGSIVIQPPDTPLPARVPSSIVSTTDLRRLFRELVPTWEQSVTVVVDRGGRSISIPIFVTAKLSGYDPANPPPTATSVPESLNSTVFYL